MTSLVDSLLNIPPLAAYAIILTLVFAEAAVFVGFVLPGETAVLLGGVLASTHRISLPVLLVGVVLAAIIGDSVGYEVGRHFGPRVLALAPLRRHAERLESAKAFLRTRGGWAVFFGRFTAFLRAVVPGLAGVSRMPYPRFLAFNAAGGATWGIGVALLGYAAGRSYAQVQTTLGHVSLAVLGVVALALLAVWHHRRRVAAAAKRAPA